MAEIEKALIDYEPIVNHKPGCLGNKPGWHHRSPIDCETEENLRERIAALTSAGYLQQEQIVKLKARIYDLEYQEEGD